MFGGHTADNRNSQVTRKGPIEEADYRLVTVPASAAVLRGNMATFGLRGVNIYNEGSIAMVAAV